jgi:EamA-like transporter family.
LVFSHFLTQDDKFSFLKLFSIIVGLIGVLFIFDVKSLFFLSSDQPSYFLPKLCVVIAAFGYVISSILAYSLRKIDSITLTTFVTLFAAIISLPFLILVEFQSKSSFSFISVLSLIYLGAFPTALAFLIRFHIISKAGPIFLSYVAYLIPVFAIIWGYIFLNEKITTSSFFGVILVLLGVFISQKNLVMEKKS